MTTAIEMGIISPYTKKRIPDALQSDALENVPTASEAMYVCTAISLLYYSPDHGEVPLERLSHLLELQVPPAHASTVKTRTERTNL